MRRFRVVLCLALGLAWGLSVPLGALAAGYTYVGPVGNYNWDNTSNWSPSGYPDDSGDTAAVGSGKSVNVNINSNIGGLTVGGAVNINNGKDLNLAASTTVSNTGVINLNSTGTTTQFQAYGSGVVVTLFGSGSVVLGSLDSNQLNGVSGGYFINQQTIRGGGKIYDLNYNSGTVRAEGTMQIEGDVNNTGGVIQSSSGSTLNVADSITGGHLDANGGTINLGIGGAVETLNGVNLGNGVGGTIYLYDSYNWWGPATLAAGETLRVTNGNNLNLTNVTYTNNGTIRLDSSGSTTDMKANGMVTLGGSGKVVLGGIADNRLKEDYGGYTNDTNHTIEGGGTIDALITNKGTITASNASYNLILAQNITLQGGTLSSANNGVFLNQATISGYGTISGRVTNTGHIINASGGTLNISGRIDNGNLNPGSNIISLEGGAYLYYLTLGSGNYTIEGGINQVEGCGATLPFNVDINSGTLRLINYISVTDHVNVKPMGFLDHYGSANFDLDGYVVLKGGTLMSSNGCTYNTPSGGTYSGYGTIAAAVNNRGTLKASGGVSGTPRILRLTGNIANTGHVLDTAGAYNTLWLESTVTGGAVNPNSGAVELKGATLIGTSIGAGTVDVTANSTVQGGTTLDSATTVSVDDYKTLTVKDGVSGAGANLNPGDGAVNLDASAALSNLDLGAGVFRAVQNSSITGGTVNADADFTVDSGKTLTLNSLTSLSNIFHISGTLKQGSAAILTLTGAKDCKLTDGALSAATGGSFTNASGHLIQGYGTISAPLTNQGTVTAKEGAGGNPRTLTLTGDVTNTGGTLNTNGVYNYLQLQSQVTQGNVNPNGGTVVLNGAYLDETSLGAGAFTVGGGTNTLDTATVNPGAAFTITAGTLRLLGINSLDNAFGITGILDNRDTASAVTLTGAQNFDLTGGTLQSTGSPVKGFTNASGHLIQGYGAISAPLTNQGTVTVRGGGALGDAKTLTVTGNIANNGGVLNTDGAYNTLEVKSQVTQGTVAPNGGTVALNGGAYLQQASLAAGAFTVGAGANTVNACTLDNSADFTLTGGTLSLIGYTAVSNPFTVNSGGALDNAHVSSDFTLSNNITLAGGTLASSTGRSYINPTSNTYAGYGTISANITNDGTLRASGGALMLSGNITNSGDTLDTAGSGNILAISGAVIGGGINPSGGMVHLVNGTLSGTTLGSGNVYVMGSSALTGGATLATDTLVSLMGPGSTLNLSGIVSGGQFKFDLGGGQVNLMGAEVSGATLGSGAVAVISDSTLSGSNTTAATLTVWNGMTLNLTGGAVLTNNGNIQVGSPVAVPKSTSLNNSGSDDTTLGGSGTVTLGGDLKHTITSTGGGAIVNNATIQGGGTIAAHVVNNGTLIANHKIMSISGQVSGDGGVQVNNVATLSVTGSVTGSSNVAVNDDGILDLQGTFQVGNLTLAEAARWIVADTKSLNLTGNFSFAQKEEDKWQYDHQSGVGPAFLFNGGGAASLEIGGRNYGLNEQGFQGNFHLVALDLDKIDTYLNLADAIDNGHRGSDEALYVETLSVPKDTTLNLNGLWLYTYFNHDITAVVNGDTRFGGGTIIGSPVPLPSSLMLLGSGLLGLAGLARRRRKT